MPIDPRLVDLTTDELGLLPPVNRVLSKDDGPLCWIDCEMTGLDLGKDRLLEIACIITDGNLEPVDEGVSFVIQTDKAVLDGMGEWCTDQHGKSGLTALCLSPSPTALPHDVVQTLIYTYLTSRVPTPQAAILSGNSVHADLAFLRLEEGRGMRVVSEHLHYRIVDVSTIKELCYRWYPKTSKSLSQSRHNAKPSGSSHRALDDIRASIAELKGYRSSIFIDPSTDASAAGKVV